MSHTNFLGIPVEGNIVRGDRRVEQRPLEDLQPILRAVLEDARVRSVRWRQYTPYFMDGDPCVFSAGEISVLAPRLGGTNFESDYAEDEVEDDEHFQWMDHWSLGYYGERDSKPELVELKAATNELSQALESGAFDNVLLEAFGDHATVTLTAEKIIVDFYVHD